MYEYNINKGKQYDRKRKKPNCIDKKNYKMCDELNKLYIHTEKKINLKIENVGNNFFTKKDHHR